MRLDRHARRRQRHAAALPQVQRHGVRQGRVGAASGRSSARRRGPGEAAPICHLLTPCRRPRHARAEGGQTGRDVDGLTYHPYVVRVAPVRDPRTTRTVPAYLPYAEASQVDLAVRPTWPDGRANLARPRCRVASGSAGPRAGPRTELRHSLSAPGGHFAKPHIGSAVGSGLWPWVAGFALSASRPSAWGVRGRARKLDRAHRCWRTELAPDPAPRME